MVGLFDRQKYKREITAVLKHHFNSCLIMIKILSIILFLVSITTAAASDRACNEIALDQAYRYIDMRGTRACFVYTKTDEQYGGQLSRDPDGISVYAISKSGKPTLVYELPYAGTKGKVIDAFLLSVDGGPDEMLFVIHSIETPRSWDAVSDIYDVSVIRLQEETLVQDKKLSRFFDLGGNLVDAQGRTTYLYPYKNKKTVEEAVRSRLFDAIHSSTPIEGTMQEKSFLYGGELEPFLQDPSKMYLIKGDQITLKDSTAGWCKVSYTTKTKPITMWVQCKSIKFP